MILGLSRLQTNLSVEASSTLTNQVSTRKIKCHRRKNQRVYKTWSWLVITASLNLVGQYAASNQKYGIVGGRIIYFCLHLHFV